MPNEFYKKQCHVWCFYNSTALLIYLQKWSSFALPSCTCSTCNFASPTPNFRLTRGMQCIVGASVILCPDLGQGAAWIDHTDIHGITYVPYIHTYRESSSQLTSVGLAALAPIIVDLQSQILTQKARVRLLETIAIKCLCGQLMFDHLFHHFDLCVCTLIFGHS